MTRQLSPEEANEIIDAYHSTKYREPALVRNRMLAAAATDPPFPVRHMARHMLMNPRYEKPGGGAWLNNEKHALQIIAAIGRLLVQKGECRE